MHDEEELYKAVARAGVRGVLIGRQALIALGLPVLTHEYDYWIHIDDIQKFNDALEPLEFFPNRTPEEARARGRYVLENSTKIDVLVAREVPTIDGVRVSFQDLWDHREIVHVTAGVDIAIPSLDDLIATKRFAARPKDAEDIRMLEVLRSTRGT